MLFRIALTFPFNIFRSKERATELSYCLATAWLQEGEVKRRMLCTPGCFLGLFFPRILQRVRESTESSTPAMSVSSTAVVHWPFWWLLTHRQKFPERCAASFQSTPSTPVSNHCYPPKSTPHARSGQQPNPASKLLVARPSTRRIPHSHMPLFHNRLDQMDQPHFQWHDRSLEASIVAFSSGPPLDLRPESLEARTWEGSGPTISNRASSLCLLS